MRKVVKAAQNCCLQLSSLHYRPWQSIAQPDTIERQRCCRKCYPGTGDLRHTLCMQKTALGAQKKLHTTPTTLPSHPSSTTSMSSPRTTVSSVVPYFAQPTFDSCWHFSTTTPFVESTKYKSHEPPCKTNVNSKSVWRGTTCERVQGGHPPRNGTLKVALPGGPGPT